MHSSNQTMKRAPACACHMLVGRGQSWEERKPWKPSATALPSGVFTCISSSQG